MNIEPLESRIAPATLVNPTTVTFTDIDGDLVTVKVSRGELAEADFTFDPPFATAGPQQLQLINFSDDGAEFDGANLSVTARRSATGGDGFVSVGAINASGVDLGNVFVRGDLGQIDAGDFFATDLSLKKLTAQSLGRFGTSTQLAGADLVSSISGPVGTIDIRGDVRDARIDVLAVSPDPESGTIRQLFIGGSLVGGAAPISGMIATSGAIGEVKIGGDVRGGDGDSSGRIAASGSITKLTIGGSVRGGLGNDSGTVFTDGAFARPVKIGGDIEGGDGLRSGVVRASGAATMVNLLGSLRGGDGDDSGRIEADGGFAQVKIGHDILGGIGMSSARIVSPAGLGNVMIGGSVINDGFGSAELVSTGGSIKIGGDLASQSRLGGFARVMIGGSVRSSLILNLPRASTVQIGGDVIASEISGEEIGSLVIAGSIRSSPGTDVDIVADRAIGRMSVGGSIVGTANDDVQIAGAGNGTTGVTDLAIGRLTVGGSVEHARIRAGDVTTFGNADAQIGPVIVGGDWIASSLAAGVNRIDDFYGNDDDAKVAGATFKDDAALFSRIASITIKGQVLGTVGGTDHFGFVAEIIGTLKLGTFASGGITSIPLLPTPHLDNVPIGATGDVRANEI